MAGSQPIPARARTGCSFALALGLAAALVGCAEDVILPVDTTCGDLVRDQDEECDLTSAGCVECRIASGWTCDDARCSPSCGDSRTVGDEECDPPDGVTCDSGCRAATKSEPCDLSGYWIIRQVDFSLDTVVSQVQTSNNWYAYLVEQTGDRFEVQRGLSCGIRVTGSATVELTDAGTRALMRRNSQGVDSPRGARTGTFERQGDQCRFEMARNYLVRGGEDALLPDDFSSSPALDTLQPLPTADDLDGAEDTDGDGELGIAFVLSGTAAGTRHVVQRDWNEYFTIDALPIPIHAIEFTTASEFDNQENILAVEGCPVLGCGLIEADSVPDQVRQDRVTFRYLGRDLDDPRVSAVITRALREDEDADFETCANVRTALPHDSSKE